MLGVILYACVLNVHSCCQDSSRNECCQSSFPSLVTLAILSLFNFYQCDGWKLEFIFLVCFFFFLNQVYYLNKIGVLVSEFLLSNFLAIFRHMVSID